MEFNADFPFLKNLKPVCCYLQANGKRKPKGCSWGDFDSNIRQMRSPIVSKHQCSMLSTISKSFHYGTFYQIPCRIWSTNVIKIPEHYCTKKIYISSFTENPSVLFIIHSDFYILTVYYGFFLVIYVRLF